MKNLEFLELSKYAISKSGDVFSLRSNRLLTGWESYYGYRLVGMTDDNGVVVQIPVHRLVASAFIPNPENKPQVNHKDGVKLNNHVNNLEWVTPSENLIHAYESKLTNGKLSQNGEYLKGDYIETSSFTEDDIHTVCKLISEGYRDVDIARITGFGRRNINNLRHKERNFWYHITSQYSFSFSKEERMSPELVILICERLQQGAGVMALARELSLNRKKVGNIKSRRTFTDISKSYKW